MTAFWVLIAVATAANAWCAVHYRYPAMNGAAAVTGGVMLVLHALGVFL